MNTRSRTQSFLSLAALSAFALMAGTSNAAPIAIGNHSFEETNTGFWRLSSNGSDANPVLTFNVDTNAQYDTPPDGTTTIKHSNGQSAHDVYQVLGTTLAANTTYTLTVDIGDRTNHGPGTPLLRLGTVSAIPTATHDYGLNLLTGTVVANTTPVNGAGASDGWETWITTFETGASPTGLGDALRVELENVGGVQALFDNVHLDAVTAANVAPEPSTLMLAVLGLVGLVGTRRRKR